MARGMEFEPEEQVTLENDERGDCEGGEQDDPGGGVDEVVCEGFGDKADDDAGAAGADDTGDFVLERSALGAAVEAQVLECDDGEEGGADMVDVGCFVGIELLK